MNNVETLRAANLLSAFYCWGTRDGFAGQFTQNSNAVREAGCEVETHILQGYPHGYGAAGNVDVWGARFDAFLTRIMSGGANAVSQVKLNARTDVDVREMYDLNGRKVNVSDAARGVYIVRGADGNGRLMRISHS